MSHITHRQLQPLWGISTRMGRLSIWWLLRVI
jgi:hypothetical protein